MAKIKTLKDLEEFQWSGSELVQSLTNGAHLLLFAYSPEVQALVAWSANAARILGVPDSKIMRDGNLFLRHVHPDDRFLLMTDLENALAGKTEYRATYRWIRPDTNEVRWLHCRATLVCREEADVFEGVIVDLTPEITGTVSRVAGPDSLATILDAFSTTVIILDTDLRILRINRKQTVNLFSFGDPNFDHAKFRIGHPLLPCLSDSDQRRRLNSAFKQVLSGEEPQFKTRITEENFVFQLAVTPVHEGDVISGILLTISDVSELVSLEKQIADLQKAEGLRLIAAGVSHNFNNALQSIIGHAAVIQNHPDNTQLVLDSSQAIMDVVNKTSDLSKQLYQMDAEPPHSLNPIELNLVVMAAVNKIDSLFASGAKITVVFGGSAPVMAQQRALVDAITAILRNAKENLKTNGTISIKTEQQSLGELEVQDLPKGYYARLVVSDNGPGMSAEALERCLDPFFTTAEADPQTGVGLKRHGLGLSAAFSIIRRFNGGISIDSEPGSGTSLSIYLPLASAPALRSKTIEIKNKFFSNPPLVLLIDDDHVVVETVTAILADLGISSISAEDGKSGLAQLRKHRHSIKTVLVDAIMPGISGAALVRQLKEINSSVPVIGFTGAPPEVTESMLQAGANEILRKPVGLADLKSLIEQSIQTEKAA